MAKGVSKSAADAGGRPGGMSPVNTDELEAVLYWAERRVLEIQAKLHRWAIGDRERRFDDLFVRHEAR